MSFPGRRLIASSYALLAVERPETRAITLVLIVPKLHPKREIIGASGRQSGNKTKSKGTHGQITTLASLRGDERVE
jgi:hypothetical protein